MMIEEKNQTYNMERVENPQSRNYGVNNIYWLKFIQH